MNNKKWVSIISGICILLVLVGSATYAYFLVGTNFESYTTNIRAEAENIGSVAITNSNNLQLNVTNKDMMIQEGDVSYYATSNGKTTVETSESVGQMIVTGEGMYTCEYTLELNDNENSMYDTFQNMSTKSTGQLILTIDGQEMDLATPNLFPKTIIKTVTGLTQDTPKDIYAQLELTNKSDIDQSDLAGKEMDLNINVTDFSCAVEEIELPVESDNLSTEILGGLYRYQGSKDEVNDNYICFGTNDAETCKTNEDTYMYRIIGVTPDGELKVIKKTSIGEFKWWSNGNGPLLYPDSLVYSEINGNNYLTNSTYIPNGWEEKISTKYWKFGIMADEELGGWFMNLTLTGTLFFGVEGNFKTSIDAKIGLMYAHDFCYQNKNATCTDELKSGWLNIQNNDNTTTNFDEWIISEYGYLDIDPAYNTWYVMGDEITLKRLYHVCATRPVFYLKSGLTIRGEGTLNSPYIIS